MRSIHLLAVLPLTCLFATGVLAQACNKPLVPKNMVQMTSIDGGPSSLPVKINGTDQKLTFATAGTTTQLTATAAKTLKLDPARSDAVITDPFGNSRRMDEVTIADFSVGTMHGSNVKWLVPNTGGRGGGGDSGGRGGSGDDSGGPGSAENSDRPAGVFSLNYMRLYDIDVDFGSDRLIFFDQNHCPGGVLYWKAPGAVGVVPMTIDNGRVVAPVTVNGRTVNAVIDTASPFSTVRQAVAEKVLGVELGGAKAPADRPSKDPFGGGQTYTWTTDAIAFGPLKLENVALNVRPDINAGAGDHGDGAQGLRARASALEAELGKPEITLGMDTLRKLHLFLSFAESRLYVTGTTSTLPAAAAPAKAP